MKIVEITHQRINKLSSRESIPTKRSLQISRDDHILPAQHTIKSPNRQPTQRRTPSAYPTCHLHISMTSSHTTDSIYVSSSCYAEFLLRAIS